MYRLFLAGRYTLARPVSYLAMVAIGLAVMALIVVVSIMNGFLDETKDVIRGTTADIVVFPEQGTHPVPKEALEGAVSLHPDVTGAVARLVRPAVFKVHGRTNAFLGSSQHGMRAQVLVLGIDADREFAHTDLADYLARVDDPALAVVDRGDPFFLPEDRIIDRTLRWADLPTCLLSTTFMNAVHLSRGDAIELVTVPDGVDLDGGPIAPSSQTFVVAGAFDTGHYDFDQSTVFVEDDVFPGWAVTSQELSELYVTCREGTDLERVRDELRIALLAQRMPCLVETWRDRHRIWLGAVENERNILFVIFGFFLLLVCTITFSVLTMLVKEKVRDIGILSAMGAPALGIGTVFALVGTCIASLGGLIGLVAGWTLAAHVNEVKDWIESTFSIQIFRRDVYAFSDIPTTIDPGLNLGIAVLTVVGAVVFCLLPAVKAALLDPVEALRHD